MKKENGFVFERKFYRNFIKNEENRLQKTMNFAVGFFTIKEKHL